MKMTNYSAEFLPAFGIPYHQDQYPLCLYTVLSVNEQVGDCAAYQGIGPVNADEAMLETIKSKGMKFSREKAVRMFPETEDSNLRYRI